VASGFRTEHFHYSPEQVRGHLVDALAIVDELDPPADLLDDRLFRGQHVQRLLEHERTQVQSGVPLPPILRR